jgi:hypothetical protein
MNRKYQVILPDWLEDYIKFLVDRYELNFSEVIRLQICHSVLCLMEKIYPEFKSNLSIEDIAMIPKDYPKTQDREELLRRLSKIYFETRKAVEYRLEKENSS